MRNWIVRFRSYASTSNIKLVGMADQRSVLRACLAPDLEVNLEGGLATLASTVETCLLAIEAHFLSLQPIFTRRWYCFRIKKSGRPFKDYVADLRRSVAEADIKNMSAEQLMVFMLLMGCQTETALFVDLRKLVDPTITDLMTKIKTIEQALKDALVTTAVVTTVTTVATNVAACLPVVETKAEIIVALASACSGCQCAHDRSICLFRKAECFRCKKVGHIRERCSSTSRGEANDRGRSGDQRSSGRGGYPRGGSPAGKYNHDASRSLSTTRVCAIATPSSDNMQVELACVAPGAVFVLDVLPDLRAARTVLRTVPPGAVLMPSSTRLIAANSGQLRNLGKLEFVAMAQGGAPVTKMLGQQQSLIKCVTM
jgi:hypothetical protein